MTSPSAPNGKLIRVKNRNLIEQHEHEDDALARRVLLVTGEGDIIPFIDTGDGIPRLPVDAEFNFTTDIVNVDIKHPSTFEIINHTVVTANSEFEIALPNNTKRFTIKVRGHAAKLRLAQNLGETNTNYETIERGTLWESNNVDPADNYSVFLQSTKNNVIIEIKCWKL